MKLCTYTLNDSKKDLIGVLLDNPWLKLKCFFWRDKTKRFNCNPKLES